MPRVQYHQSNQQQAFDYSHKQQEKQVEFQEQPFQEQPVQQEQQLTFEDNTVKQTNLKRNLIILLFLLFLGITVFADTNQKSQKGFCNQNKISCQGLNKDVKKYIQINSLNNDQAQSIIQMANVYQNFFNTDSNGDSNANYNADYNSDSEFTQNQYQQFFRKFIKSIQCAQYANSNTYQTHATSLKKIYINQYNSLHYLKMIQQFSGQPIQRKPNQLKYQSCDFNISIPVQDQNYNKAQNQKGKIYIINGIGSTPEIRLMYLQQMATQVTKLNISINQIVSITPDRRWESLLQSIYKSKQHISLPQKEQIKSSLLNLYAKKNKSGFTDQKSKKILQLITSILENQMQAIQHNYNIDSHIHIIGQSLREGHKVIIMGLSIVKKYAEYIKQLFPQQYQDKIGLAFLDDLNKGRVHDKKIKLQQGLLKKLSQIYHQTNTPTAVQNSGQITIQITWNGTQQGNHKQKSDVDLHVIEPNGTHVYMGHKKGYVGHLDVDKLNPPGPEHYYANKQNIISGVYEININYYQGQGPSHILVSVNAGPQFMIKRLLIPKPSKKPKSMPYHICRIQVIKQERSKNFRFNIIQNKQTNNI